MSSDAPTTDSIQPPDASGPQTEEGQAIKSEDQIVFIPPPSISGVPVSALEAPKADDASTITEQPPARSVVDVAPADAATANAMRENGLKEGDTIQTETGETLRIGTLTPTEPTDTEKLEILKNGVFALHQRLTRVESALARFLSDPGAVSADVGHLEACHRELQGSPANPA